MRSFLYVSLLALAACGGAENVPIETRPEGAAPGPNCPASGYQDMVGRQLAAVTLPDDLYTRIIRPGDVVTMEYIAGRMTIEVDEEGVITSIRCG